MFYLFIINLLALVSTTIMYYDSGITQEQYIAFMVCVLINMWVASTLDAILKHATKQKECCDD